MYIEEYRKLTVTYIHDAEWREQRHQGYDFIIQNNFSAHSAHHTLLGLVSWMKFRGLDFGEPWHMELNKNTMTLVPGYRTISTMSLDYYNRVKEQFTDTVPYLSNGRYTEAIRIPVLEGDNDELVTLLYLNVNVKERKESLNIYDKDLVNGLLEGIFG